MFSDLPTPSVLQNLSAGRLGDRLQRSFRLWAILHQLHSDASSLNLTQPFRYADLRDRLFAPTHPKQDTLSAEAQSAQCRSTDCICQRSLADWLLDTLPTVSLEDWQQEIVNLSGLSTIAVQEQLAQRPFATVHRSLRDDLKLLVELGWLRSPVGRRYETIPPEQWPQLAESQRQTQATLELSGGLLWELIRLLEPLALIQPDVELILQALWEQMNPASLRRSGLEPLQRVFVHFDYILPPETQEQVDTYQEQLQRLWRSPEGGVVRFDYWRAQRERVTVEVYPVCLHYVRRAKYLSAYGIDPSGQLGWHNYRLDRVGSERLEVLSWDNPKVPQALSELHRAGQLPTPDKVEAELARAWGFNFYLPRRLLIMRFPAAFAQWYVDKTERHPTFRSVPHEDLPGLLTQEIEDEKERREVLAIVGRLSPEDVYYRGWVRVGDINVVMRLRDWRPMGEVVAPLVLRRRMRAEAEQELRQYGKP